MLEKLDFLVRFWELNARHATVGEPLSSLEQVELCRLLRTLARERSIGVLMASHDLNLAGAFADRLLLLHEGTVVADGKPADVLEPALLSRVYGLPMDRIARGEDVLVFPHI